MRVDYISHIGQTAIRDLNCVLIEYLMEFIAFLKMQANKIQKPLAYFRLDRVTKGGVKIYDFSWSSCFFAIIVRIGFIVAFQFVMSACG